MDTRHFVQGWPGIPLFPGLDLPHMCTGPWLGFYPAGPWPPPLPLLAGAGTPAGFPSVFRPAYNCRPHMEPIGECLSKQTLVDRCGSWPHRRQVAAGWAQALRDLPPVSLLCQSSGLRTWALAQMKHLQPPGVSIDAKGASLVTSLRVVRIDPPGPLPGEKMARTTHSLLRTLMLAQGRMGRGRLGRTGSPLSVGATWMLVPGSLQVWAAHAALTPNPMVM